MNFNTFLENLKPNHFLNLYSYGSFVYGTNHSDSDYDYILIISDEQNPDLVFHTTPNPKTTNYHIYKKSQFIEKIQNHDIDALECLWLPQNLKYESIDMSQFFILDKNLLRHNFSEKSSNSWVKCKKKLTIEKDYNPFIGKKSLFHSFRILDFGIQIAKYGKITDYSSSNQILKNILNLNTWDEINQNFKLSYNQKSSEFKSLAPKKTISI